MCDARNRNGDGAQRPYRDRVCLQTRAAKKKKGPFANRSKGYRFHSVQYSFVRSIHGIGRLSSSDTSRAGTDPAGI